MTYWAGTTNAVEAKLSRPVYTASMRLRHGTYDLEVHRTKVVLVSPVQQVDGIMSHGVFRKAVKLAETNIYSVVTYHSQTDEVFWSYRPMGVSTRNPMRLIVTNRFGTTNFEMECDPHKMIAFLRRGIKLLDLVEVGEVMDG